MKDTIDLVILTTEKKLFDGQVLSVSSVNSKGKFDVLPQHANFISLIFDSLKVRMTDGSQKEYPITNGILRVKQAKVEVYLGL